MLIRIRAVEVFSEKNATDLVIPKEGLLDIRGPYNMSLGELLQEAEVMGGQASLLSLLCAQGKQMVKKRAAFTKDTFHRNLVPRKPYQYWRHEETGKNGYKIQVMITRVSIPRLISRSILSR